MTSGSAEASLARLRRQLTVALALASLIAVIVLAVIISVVESDLQEQRYEAELQGHAFRAAALVYADDQNRWNTEGVVNDVVMERTDSVLVVEAGSGEPLLATDRFDGTDQMVAAVLADAAENGTIGSIVVNGEERIAAGAPFFGTLEPPRPELDGVAGVALVTTDGDLSTAPRAQLITLVWVTAAALGVLSAALAWVVAGRVVRPLGARLDREEAFLATAAHELRTPLGRFRAVTEAALLSSRGLPASPARDEVVNDLRRSLQLNTEMTNSVGDLLYLGRVEAGVAALDQAPLLLDQLVAAFEATTPELAVRTPGPVEIFGDATLLHHAFANLIGNAQKHGRRSDRSLLIEASVEIDGPDAVVFVFDNGHGLGPLPDLLFERHSTSGISSGLGLWIVRRIVEDHQGTIIGRDHDDGAVFEVRLPRSSPSADD